MKFRLAEKFNESDESVTTFVWEPERPITWSAGQYVKYILPHDNPDDRGKTRWFTIAAPPFEGRPRITTRFATEKGSSFKTKLRSLQVGDSIEAMDPEGDFLFDTSRPAVLVAGGIGITPFRAMLQQLDHDGVDFKAHLLYGNRTEQFVFKEQLETIAAKRPNFKVTYFSDPQHIELSDIQQAAAFYTDPVYYLSGPEPMVAHYRDLLTQSGIAEENIKLDDFPGYDWPKL